MQEYPAHKRRMNGKKANRAALEPGFATVQPAARDATQWAHLNRFHRRRSVAIMQGSTRDKKTGEVTKRSLRKYSQAVQYAKGVADFGVCPTQPRPIDARVL